MDEKVYLNDEKLKEVFNIFVKENKNKNVDNKIFNIEDEENNNVVNIQEIIKELKLDEKEFYEYFEKNEENNNNSKENENNFIDYEEFIEIIKEILDTNNN